jgi:hypothetical protein
MKKTGRGKKEKPVVVRRRCVIVGKGESRWTERDWWRPGDEFWTLNDAVDARSTAHFELHYGVQRYPVVPDGCVLWVLPAVADRRVGEVLPVKQLEERWCPRVRGIPVPKWGNTVCYMLAMVLERGDIGGVYLAGVDLLANRRARVVEIENVLYWLGVLAGAGIEVQLPAGSALAERWIYPE